MEQLAKRFGLSSLPSVSTILVFTAVVACLIYRLVSLTLFNATPSELVTVQTAQAWHNVWHHLFDAPYFVVLRLEQYLNHSLFYSRLITVIFGLVAVLLMYYVVHKWLGWKLAITITLLFGTNSYFLHTARLVDPYILQLLLPLTLLAMFCAIYKRPDRKAVLVWASVLPILLYIPGSLWLVMPALVLSGQHLRAGWQETTKLGRVGYSFVSVVLLAPLVYSLATSMSIEKLTTWLGVNLHGSLLHIVKTYFENLARLPWHLFWHAGGISNPVLGVANLPAVGLAVAVLALLGLYVVGSRWHDQRWRLLLCLLVVSWLASGLGQLNAAVTLPIVYILSGIGLAYLLTDWYKVFPRNPIARGLGFGLILAVVALGVVYNLRAYFVAWPHDQATIQAFNCPPVSPRPSGCLQSDF